MLPSWPLDEAIPAFTVRSLPAEGGSQLHRGVFPEYSGNLGALRFTYTANQMAVLRQVNGVLDEDDTIIFTNPAQVLAFQQALGGAALRARTVLQIHGDYAHHKELWEPLKSVRGSLDRLQTVADGLRAQFIDLFGDSNVEFIPNFPGEGKRAIPRVSHEGVNIVLPASLQHRKNQLDAVRALAKIDDASVRLSLWGSASPLNPYVSAVRDEIARLGLDDRVNLCGFGSEQDVYSEADIVLMTSLSEGFGYPLVEAMSHSLPVVSYDYNFGAREAIEDGRTGFLIPMLDVDLLATRLGELSADASMRERFGAAGRKRYEQLFSQEAVGKRYEKFLGPRGKAIDLTEVFAVEVGKPISTEQISHRLKRRGLTRYHQIRVSSDAPVHDVQIDNSERVTTPTVKQRRIKRRGAAQSSRETLIQFPAFGKEVISYTAEPGSQQRHYLGHTTTHHELKVFGHLRRDADYTPVDTLHAAQGGARHMSWSTTPKALVTFLDKGAEAVSWKVRQVATELSKHLQASRNKEQPAQTKTTDASAPRTAATPDAPKSSVPEQRPEPEAQARNKQSDGGIGEGLREFGKTLGLSNKLVTSVSSVAKSYAGSGIALLRNAVAVKEPVEPYREIGTHPW
ncbi:MAG: glycosyltransferase family 4 protein, partial [Dermabacter sp.]|nr:glycosyltransferase family 4 protein [Dermabacter sp.]